jgi:hypothetical protein
MMIQINIISLDASELEMTLLTRSPFGIPYEYLYTSGRLRTGMNTYEMLRGRPDVEVSMVND